MATIIDIRDREVKVETLTSEQQAELPGCPGCGQTCPIPTCNVCKGKMFCGPCSVEAGHGGGFFLANLKEDEDGGA